MWVSGWVCRRKDYCGEGMWVWEGTLRAFYVEGVGWLCMGVDRVDLCRERLWVFVRACVPVSECGGWCVSEGALLCTCGGKEVCTGEGD